MDTVTYTNLIPGATYEIRGVVMDKATGEPLQDAEGLFAWIDAANAERNEIDQRLGKLWQKQNAKLARAKLLADRAAAKARKAQSKIERQAKQNGGQVPYAIVKTDKQ